MSYDDSLEGIAVIGYAGRFPGAADVEQFWRNLCDGVESVSLFTKEELAASGIDVTRLPPTYVPARAILENPDYFDAAFFGYTPREAEVMDPQQRVFLETAWESLENAGYDPDRYQGFIGVFAGMANNSYFLSNLHKHPDLLEKTGAFPIMISNEKDYLTTRVSYKLNLTGPSENINTACSTSLVAVCRACHSLLSCQCDMALAGGVTIKFPQKRGTVYQEGGMTSADGHCRAFDAAATGMVPGEGVAIVVLKRLADAISDRDQILAVIKGFAVNNDGSRKVGYTAPSVVGQAQVISLAQAMGNFNAGTIGYVEAHGSATPLGDPIEMAALTKAFRETTDARNFCAVGTVKSNIGHLDAAAGAAGLIKTILVLKHKTIPPSLHFREANPNLNLEESPFFINSCLRPWPTGAVPRRAGVSSFGIGGTNAHVVLEEAPSFESSGRSRPLHLLVVSARTNTALEQAIQNLENFIRAHPDVDFADLEYTLQVGRRTFCHRRFVVCARGEDAATALRSSDSTCTGAGVEENHDTAVVFMFPGQGAQHVGMALEVYRDEPVFRREIDLCAKLLAPQIGRNLCELLYPEPDARKQASNDLNQTQFTQPALFAVEYALARLWQSWGVHPRAMVGHSVGEYVCACLAGVFTLEGALALVSERGRLIQGLPSGAMLAVRLPEQELKSLLDDGLSIAAVNSPSTTVVSGSHGAVDRLKNRLGNLKVPCRPVRTSHAFHSSMMDPVVAPFIRAVARTGVNTPRIPFISNVTGKWIRNEEATSPDYWGRHLRESVRFALGLEELLRRPDFVLLEVGPGHTLRQATTQQWRRKLEYEPLTSLPSPQEERSSTSHLFRSLGCLWLAGVPIDWEAFHSGWNRQRLALPTYPFERKRYWVEAKMPRGGPQELVQEPPPEKTSDTVQVSLQASAATLGAGLPASIGSAQAAVVSLLRELSALDDLSPTATFVEMGLDSLFLSQVSLSLQSRFGIKITFRQLQQELSTINALAAHLEKVAPEKLPVSRPEMSASATTAALADSSQAAFSEIYRDRSTSPYRPPELEPAEELSPRQRKHLDELISRYTDRTSRSKQLTQVHRPHMADPRSVAGFRLFWKEMVYPIVTEWSQGSKVRDVDGNEYVDLTMGFGANLFGHAPPFITEALQAQLGRGMEIGPQSILSGEVADMICKMTGSDRAAFCNTGSEAVLAALRMARTVTRKNKVALFAGSYHGVFDEVLVRPPATRGQSPLVPLAPGIPPSMLHNVVVLDYGNPEALQILREQEYELAAVLVEPVQSRHPDLQPREFLHELRHLADAFGIALIFDEIITGFRCHPGGAQAHFGVQADISTYGKVIAGGMPFGVVAGKARFMDALDGGHWMYGDNSVPEADVTYFAGTFVRHPLALAAARAALCGLQEQSPSLQIRLNRSCSELVRRISQWIAGRGLPFRLETFSSWFHLKWSSQVKHAGLLYFHLREKGIHILEGRPCFLSTAHTEEDLSRIATAFQDSVAELQSAGFLTEAGWDAESSRPSEFTSKIPESTTLPLTAVQQDLWLASQADDDAARAYHLAFVFRLRGELDREALIQALQDLVDRHDALRTCMEGAPDTQTIRSRLTVYLPLTDLSPLSESEREQELKTQAAAEAAALFDLVKGPLLRIRLVRLAENDHALLFTAHHLAVDGWSMGVIVDELGRLYSSRVRGLPCRLEPAVQFGTYARWHREQISDSGQIVDFWLRHLADLPDALELPLDRPYTANRTYRARTQTMVLDVKLVRQLKKVGSLYGCTFFHLLLSSIHAWLNRLCGQEDFVVGIAAAGQIQAETAHWGASKTLVGHCVHLLPLRTRCRGELAFSKHMQAVQRMVIDAMDHQSVALSMLVPQLRLPFDSSRVPLVPVVFNLDRSSGNCLMDGLAVEIHPTPKQFDFFDLHLNAVETGTGIQLDCTFCIDLFDSSSVEGWLRHLKVMLEAIAEDPETRVADLPMLTEAERRRILLDWNQTESDYPRECCIHELFQAQAERSPHAVAVRTGGTALSYRKLDQEANLIGRRLAMAGFRPGAFAGICAARSPEMLAGLLGILKVGGAYVPLDPDFPRERLAAIIHDADIRLIVTQQRYCGLFSEYALPLICLDGDGEIAADGHSCIPAGGVSALHPAYIMYTSGSTGKPKGVVVCHRNVARLLFGIEYVRLGPEQTILQAAPLSFDASTFEIWGALLHGGECVLHAETIPTAAGLQREIRAHGISTMWLTAALFNSVIDEAPEALFGLQQLLIGGEALSVQHVKRALEALPGTKIVNGYGPTESTTFACTYSIPEKLNSAVSSIPIGRPLANTRVYVLDRYQNPVPAGVPGEIHIGGEGVALGYLNQPQLTAERFLPDPFGEGRLYKTGDRGRFRADSNLEFLGRVDRQLKIRGFRIEPEEIETALQEHAAVKQAVVLARLQRSGEKLLVAYIVSDYQPAPGTSILRDYLKEKLPEYMIPSTFVLLDSLPRTAGGKIDWKALPDPAENRLGMEEAYAAPRNLTEEILADIWSEVLSLDRIGIHENFFSLGGHSLLATQIISRANQAFQLDIPLRCLFDSPTVARLAVAVDRMLGEAATPDCR